MDNYGDAFPHFPTKGPTKNHGVDVAWLAASNSSGSPDQRDKETKPRHAMAASKVGFNQPGGETETVYLSINPSEKYESKLIISPRIGVKIKHI